MAAVRRTIIAVPRNKSDVSKNIEIYLMLAGLSANGGKFSYNTERQHLSLTVKRLRYCNIFAKIDSKYNYMPKTYIYMVVWYEILAEPSDGTKEKFSVLEAAKGMKCFHNRGIVEAMKCDFQFDLE